MRGSALVGCARTGQSVRVYRTVGALTLVATLLTSGCAGDHKDERVVADKGPTAQELCADAAREIGDSTLVVRASDSTAEAVVADAQRFGESGEPWSGLPADQRLVHCTIVDESAQAAGPTTVCDDGSTVALEGTTTLVVDEDGQSTPGPGTEFAAAIAIVDPCLGA